MSNDKNTSVTVSVGGWWVSALGLIFITLKILGYLDWSWIWILSPFWGGCLLTILLMIGLMVLAFIKTEILK